jgi:Spy/CpxP family protein refolding chaperone
MASGSFLAGFMTAISIILAAFAGSYYLLKRTRWKHSKIKGYLDLIPDLTLEQRQRVRDIRETFLPQVERIRKDLCQKRITLARALFTESADRSLVHSAAEEILKCQSELEHAVIEHILEEKGILNERQRVDFFNIILQQFAHGGLGVHDIKAPKNSRRS